MCVCAHGGGGFFSQKAREACRSVIDRYLRRLLPHGDSLPETAAALNSRLTVASKRLQKTRPKKQQPKLKPKERDAENRGRTLGKSPPTPIMQHLQVIWLVCTKKPHLPDGCVLFG